LSRAQVLLFATACGVAVANLYYAQPVLHNIERSFTISSGSAGLVVTFSQIGYALGLASLVPLGDIVRRRKLVPTALSLTVVGLVICAFAPNVTVLMLASLLVGTGTVAAQLLIPMAASMTDDAERGRIVGMMMTGLLLGILLARTVSGLIAEASNWRVVYLIGAAMTLALALVLARTIPREQTRPRIRYLTLLASAVTYLRTEPLLQRRALYGALGFATFSVFWTTMAFLLSGSPYHYNDLTIGLFGLIGACGALCANFAGRWTDRGWSAWTTILFSVLVSGSFLVLWIGRHSLAMLIVGIVILDVGAQGLQVTNQSLIYRLAPQARSRINSAYMVCYFIGGGIGSAVGSLTYATHRWAGVCVLGAAIGFVATVVALVDARFPTQPTVHESVLEDL
jgi:predicted MFS family arabinose efflux permease